MLARLSADASPAYGFCVYPGGWSRLDESCCWNGDACGTKFVCVDRVGAWFVLGLGMPSCDGGLVTWCVSVVVCTAVTEDGDAPGA